MQASLLASGKYGASVAKEEGKVNIWDTPAISTTPAAID